MARKAPDLAAREQSVELFDADVAVHLGIRRSAKGHLNGGGFGVDVREVDSSVCFRLRLGGDEYLGYSNSLRDGDADWRRGAHLLAAALAASKRKVLDCGGISADDPADADNGRVGDCQIDVRQKDVLPSCTGKASLIEGNLHTQPGFAARSSCARTWVAWHSMHLAALEVVANR
eukprot:scaffold9134_cov67-Phaeocystis_antarctica.AAC.5